MGLSEVASRLYQLVPAEFTAARDAAAADARQSGDRDLAASIKALRRPPVAAWLANRLASERGELIGDLLDLGVTLREAQRELDGPRMRSLAPQRRDAVRTLVREAHALADGEASAPSVTQAVERDLSATLEAALADEAAAAAVRSGRLMKALHSTGLDAVDLSEAVAAPDDLAAPVADGRPSRPSLRVVADPAPQPKSGKPSATVPRKADARQAAAKDAVREARADVRSAEREVGAAEKAADGAREALEQARDRITDLENELQQARRDRRAYEQELQQCEQRQATATRQRDIARRAVTKAEATLARRKR